MKNLHYCQLTTSSQVNILVSSMELLSSYDELQGSQGWTPLRTLKIDPFYALRKLSDARKGFLQSFWDKVLWEQQKGTLSVGDYRIARRLKKVLQHELQLEGVLEENMSFNCRPTDLPHAIVACGTACSGKNYHGEELASRLGITTLDTDIFHSEGNVRKMMNDIPLSEDDRVDYIEKIEAVAKHLQSRGLPFVLIFPAHTPGVRDRLRTSIGHTVHVRFHAPMAELIMRAKTREHAYIQAQNCKQFIANQVQTNTPLTDIEKETHGDFEVSTSALNDEEEIRSYLFEKIHRSVPKEAILTTA